MEQKSVVYPIFLPAIPSKNFLQKYEKYPTYTVFSDTFFELWAHSFTGVRTAFRVPLVPHPFLCLHVLWPWCTPDGFPSVRASKNLTDFWKRCRGSDWASKIGWVGFESLKTFDSFPSVHSVRRVAKDGDGVHLCDGIWGVSCSSFQSSVIRRSEAWIG